MAKLDGADWGLEVRGDMVGGLWPDLSSLLLPITEGGSLWQPDIATPHVGARAAHPPL